MENVIVENLITLVTLTGLEVVLGVDNVIFIALLIQPLPENVRYRARLIGVSIALIFRVALLLCASWMSGLTDPAFTILGFGVSGRSMLLFSGGAFLIIKSVLDMMELFANPFHEEHAKLSTAKKPSFVAIIFQVVFIDLILSLDSIVTAVAISNHIFVIVGAIVIAMVLMLVSVKPISEFIYSNPGIKVLAICFIILVGVFLVGESFGFTIPKGYLYFAMVFSMIIEIVEIMLSRKRVLLTKAAESKKS
jgi:predicted tellurium resistance membrane protein TerC